MRCIWEGNLQDAVDNIKLCVIIKNLHFWAMNHLRSWLSSCIDRWRRSIAVLMDEEDSASDSTGSGSSLNFAFKRAATLEDFVYQDEGSAYGSDSYEDSNDEYEDSDDENSEDHKE
jgi:hypothetical protein